MYVYWFRFDIYWLKLDYQDRRNIEYSHDLDEKEKRVLLGVHQRDHKNGACLLPPGPSPIDYDTLNKAYLKA